MTNFISDAERFTARPGLYRVWVPLRDDGRVPLISIWIDPTMTAFERQQSSAEIGLPAVSAQSLRKLRTLCDASALLRASGS
jgi:hypothetical protein